MTVNPNNGVVHAMIRHTIHGWFIIKCFKVGRLPTAYCKRTRSYDVCLRPPVSAIHLRVGGYIIVARLTRRCRRFAMLCR